jgi:hypothetical protein
MNYARHTFARKNRSPIQQSSYGSPGSPQARITQGPLPIHTETTQGYHFYENLKPLAPILSEEPMTTPDPGKEVKDHHSYKNFGSLNPTMVL